MTVTVTIRVLFFGMLKDIVGRAEDTLDLPAGATLASVFEHYAAQFPKLESYSRSIVLASNAKFAERTTPVAEGDEVAFLPPVSGGKDVFTHQIEDPQGHFFALTRGTIDTPALVKRLQRGCDGAVVTFEGVVRDNSDGRTTRYLDYECYEAMAIGVMAQIGRDIAASHEISRIAMIHRLGRLEIGEASVSIVTVSPHRAPAFHAALEGINKLKKLVPIWKKEHFTDGEVWVEGSWDESVAGL